MKLIKFIKKIPTCNLIFILFLLPFIRLFLYHTYDNDFWFTINQGRYILEHGFMTKAINVIHDLDFIFQSYGSGVLFYLIYRYLGKIGIVSLLIIISELTAYFFYKLCFTISNKKKKSLIITILVMIIYNTLFLVTRPHIFTNLNLVIMFYLLESYLKTFKRKYLFFLPIISLLEINMHGIYFIILLIIISPYLINSFKFNILGINSIGYKKKDLIITFILMFLVGFINPYGYKTIIYGFSSYNSGSVLNNYVNELLALNFHDLAGKIGIVLIILVYIIYFKSKKRIPLRYYLLLLGTSYLAFDAYKSYYFFLIAGIFPLAYILNLNIEEEINYSKKYYFFHLSLTIVFSLLILCFYKDRNLPNTKNILDYLDSLNLPKEKIKLYTNFIDGSYAEYRGYYCYMDPRAEVFLKSNNHREDIFKEYRDLQAFELDYKEFLDKYKFDYLLVNKESDILYKLLKFDNKNYDIVYEDNNIIIYKLVL